MKKIILSILLLQSNYNMELDKIENKIYSKPMMINQNCIILNLFFFNNKSKDENALIIKNIEKSIKNEQIIKSDQMIKKLYHYFKEDIFAFITKQKNKNHITHNPQYLFHSNTNDQKNTMLYLEPKIIQNTDIQQETLYIIISEKNSNFDLQKILNNINKNENTEYNDQWHTTQNTTINTILNIIHNQYSNIIVYKEENNGFKKITPNKEIKDIHMTIYNQEMGVKLAFEHFNNIIKKFNNKNETANNELNETANNELLEENILQFIKIPKDTIEKIKILSTIIKEFNTNYESNNFTEKKKTKKDYQK